MRKEKSFAHIDDPLIVADLFSETVGGGSNTSAALGNGSLTVGISPWGELVYFRWPNPSFYDHLRYVTESYSMLSGLLSVKDVRMGADALNEDWQKYGRPREKYPHLGAKAGICLNEQKVLWQDEPVWSSQRKYLPEWSHLLETRLTGNVTDSDNAEMSVRQWVMPDEDILIQHYLIDAPEATALFFHGTFAPWMTNPNSITNPDSSRAGFAALYSKQEQMVYWFFPDTADTALIKPDKPNKSRKSKKQIIRELRAMDTGSGFTSESLDAVCDGQGIFIAMGAKENIDQYQIGADTNGRPVSKNHPAGGRQDSEDGQLQGNALHIGHADAAIKIALPAKKKKEAMIVTAVAHTAKEASLMVRQAKKKTVTSLRDRAEKKWKKDADQIFLPAKASKDEKRVARRSIINLMVGRDKNTGAIVAAPTRQPCYACDWPRDGAFYDMALDLAGRHDLVQDHLQFYRRTQRRENRAFSTTWLASFRSPFFKPRGHWYANMNTDGSPGFFKIIPIEIDETSLMVWNIWRHKQYVPKAQQKAYRESMIDMFLLAMEGIMPYLDWKNGWTKKIMEDDNHKIAATLHGASAVLTALACAADLAKDWEIEAEKQQLWQKGASVLRRGMLKKIQDPKTLDQAGWRGLQWSLFPAPLFEDYQDEAAAPFLARIAEDLIEKVIYKKGGVGYLGEQLFMLAYSTQHFDKKNVAVSVVQQLINKHGIPENKKNLVGLTFRRLKKQVLDLFVSEVPMPGTDCYGELGLWTELADKTLYVQNRTSIPHLWNGVTAYLSVVSFYQPKLLLPLRPPIPTIS